MKLKNAAQEKKKKEKRKLIKWRSTFVNCFALRLLLDCTEDLFDQSPIELSWRITYCKFLDSFKRVYIYTFFFFETTILENEHDFYNFIIIIIFYRNIQGRASY